MKLRNPMKLSETTVNLLKNFSSINQSILFKEGNKLRSISVMKNILAEATVEESFPKDFGIYDLNQFLNGLSLHASPELDFKNNDFVMIREGKMRSKYFFADPTVIVAPPEKASTFLQKMFVLFLPVSNWRNSRRQHLSINCLISLLLVKQV